MKLLHMADVHLGMEPDKGKPWGEGRGRQLWEAFAQAIDAAEEQQVDLVLIAGDLFHRQPLKRELAEVNGILSRLTRARVVLMAGNHDYLSRNSFYRNYPWNENIRFFSSEQPEALCFPELAATVYGCSFEHREIREERYRGIVRKPQGRYHILLAHGGDEKHVPLKLKELEAMDFDYIALGHIHQPGQLRENRIVMAGNLQPMEHGDIGPRGYWIAELGPRGTHASFYPIRGCEYREVRIPVEACTANASLLRLAEERLSQLAPYQLAVLVLCGDCAPEFTPDAEALSKLPRVAAVDDRSRPGYDFVKLQQEYRGQIVDRYIKELLAMPQDEVTRRALYLGVDALMGNSHVY